LRWFLLSLVPSSLLLSITAHLTMDLAAIPLLWIIPLAIYLLSFVLAFGRQQWISRAALARIVPLVIVILVLITLLEAQEPLLLIVALELGGFFVIALMCHSELARARPPSPYLTEYYLWLAIGGVAGGVINAIIAPLVFDRLTEYPLGLVAVCFLC